MPDAMRAARTSRPPRMRSSTRTMAIRKLSLAVLSGTQNARGPVAGAASVSARGARRIARAAGSSLEALAPLAARARREQAVEVRIDLGAHDLRKNLAHAVLHL